MSYMSFGRKSISSILAMAFVISGCMPTDVASTRQGFNVTPIGEATPGPGAGNTTAGSGNGATSIPPKVEIRHLIEPNLSSDPNYTPGTGYAGGGSYVRKLTLPKNFQGRLYLAGINIGTLANRHVKVRFKFGVGRSEVVIPAVVSSAPGITPQTNIQVLVMDMRTEPFRDVRLSYDLFDYNDYSGSNTPAQDNRNTGLYCRGLRLEDDPTFVGVGQCGDQPGEECLYAFAKVLDQGLVKEVVTTTPSGTTTVLVPTTPTLPQIRSSVGNSYNDDSTAQQLNKTLSDNYLGSSLFNNQWTLLNPTTIFNLSSNPTSWDAKNIDTVNYYYRGPYRLVNKAEWQLSPFADLKGKKRLFMESRPYNGPVAAAPENNTVFYESLLFPRATTLDLQAGVPHLSSENWEDPRAETTLSVAGKTGWMDGSNARAQSKNSKLEHIGSCNVTASMEILAKDNNGIEYVVALTNEVKLQLVRAIQHYTDSGNDVLYSNFKTCTSNSSCGGSECCFNNRCWDQTLVSQCYDSSSGQGNRQTGESCLTDLECSSLCCNKTSGQCTPHNTISNPAVTCSKPIGDFCIAKEWCQKTPVVKCLVVKTGTTPLGDVTCRQQCYTTSEYGECKSGICIAPFQETIQVFDPNAPDACANAVPAPSF